MALRDYQTVDDRLREWWSDHPQGRVATWIAESHGEQRWTIAAAIYRDATDVEPAATGMAYGDPAGSSGAQATNPLEDAETSAIGRALANAGYSPKGARPSAEEMRVAESRSAAPQEDKHKSRIVAQLRKSKVPLEAFRAYLASEGFESWDEVPDNQRSAIADGVCKGVLLDDVKRFVSGGAAGDGHAPSETQEVPA